MSAISRRRLITITANVISVAAVAGPYLPALALAQDNRTGTVPDDGVDAEALATLVHDLFPHEAIAAEVYTGIARMIIAQEQGAAGDLMLLQTGLRQLNEQAGGQEWRSLDASQRLQALNKIADTEFFKTVLPRSRALLYLRPEIWQLVGYGGNALQQGGYLTRGFDDIDWLN
ncbi:MAG: Gluconate 2-dehydrogenase subunit 3 [Gammaproteobacteria bacterium]|nr:Gluconate 2-dehydrogenase subunit 3 [Gammaproteobacteria bacterium]